MPHVPEVQTIFVQAASGTYRLDGSARRHELTSTDDDVAAAVSDRARRRSSAPAHRPDRHRAVARRVRRHLHRSPSCASTPRVGRSPLAHVVEGRRRLTPAPDSSGASVDGDASSRSGTTTPARNTVQTLTIDATGGTFVLHFLRPNARRRARRRRTAPIQFDATADDLLRPINCPTGRSTRARSADAALNPNNAIRRCRSPTTSAVTKHGNVFHAHVPGRGLASARSPTSTRASSTGTARAGDAHERHQLLRRRDAEHHARLAATTSSTSRARAPITNLSTSAPATTASTSRRRRTSASPTIPTSSAALSTRSSARSTSTPAPAGTTLMISDEASARRRHDPDHRHRVRRSADGLSRDAEIWVTGLGDPGASRTGRRGRRLRRRHHLLDGLRQRHDHDRRHARPLRRPHRHVAQHRPRQRQRHRRPRRRPTTTSSCSTRRARRAPAADRGRPLRRRRLDAGRHGRRHRRRRCRSARSRQPRARHGRAAQTPAGRHARLGHRSSTRSPSRSSLGRRPERSRSRRRSGAGDTRVAFVNGVARSRARVRHADATARRRARRRPDHEDDHRRPSGRRTCSRPDDDTVAREASTLPLVIFGGQGDDIIHGGAGGDIVFGDRGRVLYFDPALPRRRRPLARSRRSRRPCSATAARATRPTASRGARASRVSVDRERSAAATRSTARTARTC